MVDPFFKLDDPFVEVREEVDFIAMLRSGRTDFTGILYRPQTLKSIFQPWKFLVEGVTFTNVSFKQTTISDFEFKDCRFQRCLFISTIFKNCRFTSCSFNECNPFRIEFQECFVDPRFFVHCIADRKYSNIGVYLFQNILRNSRQQAQPAFADEAQYQFKRWERFLLQEERTVLQRRRDRISRKLRVLSLLVFEVAAGYGMRLGRLCYSSIALLLFISTLNWLFANQLGLRQNTEAVHDFVGAFYFTTVVMTTVGFGDITPTTTVGRLFVSAEAVLGFGWFAILTSTLYRRFSS